MDLRSAVTARRREARELAARLPPLLVEANRIASVVQSGEHRRERAGPGYAFWQYRSYQPGDSVHQIDWRRSAKGNRAYIRQREWETTQTIWLWRDGSPSMFYRSQTQLPLKVERAEVLTLAAAALMVRAGEMVALLGIDRHGTAGPGSIFRLAERMVANEGSQRHQSLASLPPLQISGRMLLVGDFLDDIKTITATFDGLAAARVKACVVQIVDPAEENLPFTGPVSLEGLENEGSFRTGRIEQIQEAYQIRLRAHRQAISDYCRKHDWPFLTHHTDQPATNALLAVHQALRDS